MTNWIAIGQTNGHGVWLYAFATYDEAEQFVDAAEGFASEFPSHDAYRISWDIIPAALTTVADAAAQIKELK